MQRASLPTLVASDTTWVVSAVGSVLVLVLVWRALLWLADETRRRIAGLGQPLRRLSLLGWAVLGVGALGLLALVPEPRRDGRSPETTKTAHRPKEVFLRSPGLGSQVLLKLGPEVRTIARSTGTTDLDYAVDGGAARRARIGYGWLLRRGPLRAIVRLPDGERPYSWTSACSLAVTRARVVLAPDHTAEGTEAGDGGPSNARTRPQPLSGSSGLFRASGPDDRRNRDRRIRSIPYARPPERYGYTRRRTAPSSTLGAGEPCSKQPASTLPEPSRRRCPFWTGRYPSRPRRFVCDWVSAHSTRSSQSRPLRWREMLSAQGFVTAASRAGVLRSSARLLARLRSFRVNQRRKPR